MLSQLYHLVSLLEFSIDKLQRGIIEQTTNMITKGIRTSANKLIPRTHESLWAKTVKEDQKFIKTAIWTLNSYLSISVFLPLKLTLQLNDLD